jgi:hypothetical protein
MINKWHDPDVLHTYIKNIYNESKNGIVDNDLTEKKRVSANILYRLEVFRATMQYLEEFGIYFISYIESPEKIAKKLVKTTPKDVNYLFTQFKKKNHDKFSQEVKSVNYRELLKEIFAYDIIPQLSLDSNEINPEDIPKLIEESIDYIKEKIDKFAEFYLNYIDLYNSIKHGTRVFPHKMKHFGIKGPKDTIINIGEDYITAICKRSDGEIYSLDYPVNLLMEQSMSISNDINRIFSYLRRIIKYKLSKPQKINVTFFKSDTTPNTEKYIKVTNAESVLIIPSHPKLDEFVDKPLIGVKAFNIIKKGNTIFLHTKYDKDPSPAYPVLITMQISTNHEFTPKCSLNITFDFNIFDMDIKQYLDMTQMHNLSNDDLRGIFFFDDLNNQQIDSNLKPEDFNLPKMDLIHDKSILDFLFKLQQITQKRIPVPMDFSPNQKSIINKTMDAKISTRTKANEIIAELKNQNNKKRYTIFNVKKIDLNGNTICEKELGIIPGTVMNFDFENLVVETKFKDEIYENPKGHLWHVIEDIDADPDELIKEFKLFIEDPLNNEYPKTEVNKDIKGDPKFDLIFDYKFRNPEFWYQDHIVDITLKIKKNNR